MKRIVKEKRPFVRCEFQYRGRAWPARKATNTKRDNAERAIERGAESISFYKTGSDDASWEDLCAGPHVPHTGFLAASKIMSVSGAFWHGDQNSDQLTRVYGTCFGDKKGLKAHLQRLEEAKKRDHRKIAKEMDLLHIPEDNPGQFFWHPKGANLVPQHRKLCPRQN